MKIEFRQYNDGRYQATIGINTGTGISRLWALKELLKNLEKSEKQYERLVKKYGSMADKVANKLLILKSRKRFD